ncbi:hypothetical protein [Dyella jiangningensis]|uniref:Uncharacterized protein n=1 Tax=Dyella jiangningensis TaxID=1379159 RepID=A0A328P5C1_9GAMM|nr:hypothetical protein [Dyella jiangningensis]RAO75795.1 hypothetical protein CA260_17305 [Dyella jiangningensis]
MSSHTRRFLIHDSEATQASNTAGKRLDLLDAIDDRIHKAMAIIDLIGSAKTSNLAEETLPAACWAARSLMKEVTELLAEVGV